MLYLIFVLVLIGVLEWYAFKGLYAAVIDKPKWLKSTVSFGMILVFLLQWGGLVFLMMNFAEFRTSKPNLVMAISGFFFVVMFPKIFIAGFHMIDDVRWLIAKGVGMIKTSGEAGGPVVSRNTFLTTIGQLSGGLMLGSVLYGVTKGKYNYKVKKHVISDPLIPSEFNGTKIVQFSDAHLGSFMENFEDVQKGIDIINSLEADYVLFTGDLVNNVSSEAEPWIEVFN
ncbi:MAG: hypothetical protein ACPGED_11305, partial [Flavobacteriales bacterium]